MAETEAVSLGINLLATGITVGTGVSAAKAREIIRDRAVSEDLNDVATEFTKSLKSAIEEVDAERETGELADVLDDWGDITDELTGISGESEEAQVRERDQLSYVFTDEEEAVTRI